MRSNIAKNASGTGSGNSEFEKNDRTVNYEIGKLTSHTIEPVARLKRVSVAVIVDGTYQQPEKPAAGREATYIPRTAEEMAQLEKIVKGAINSMPTAAIPSRWSICLPDRKGRRPAGRQYAAQLGRAAATVHRNAKVHASRNLFVVFLYVRGAADNQMVDFRQHRRCRTPSATAENHRRDRTRIRRGHGRHALPGRNQPLADGRGGYIKDVMRDWMKES